jgi:hypothetical protein
MTWREIAHKILMLPADELDRTAMLLIWEVDEDDYEYRRIRPIELEVADYDKKDEVDHVHGLERGQLFFK